MAIPSEKHKEWAASAIGMDARVMHAKGLHDGSSPWLLDIRNGDRMVEAVLRVADWQRIWGEAIATAAAGLRVAAAHDLPTARLIAADADGSITGEPALLETSFPGSNTPPGPDALYSAGGRLAELHTIRVTPTSDLPLRTHHTPPDNYPGDRRWASRYQHAANSDRAAILDDFCHQHPWARPGKAQAMLTNTKTSPLLQEADNRLSQRTPPKGTHVFLHGDVWLGNMHWNNGRCLGLIDWKSAGVGHPGVDLGAIRMHAAIRYDPTAADAVTAGWEDTIGQSADEIPYWDAIAALYTPAILDGWEADDPVLDASAITARRDEFLQNALDRLDHPA